MTSTAKISRKNLLAACERWVSLTAQKRCALLRKHTVDGTGGIMRWIENEDGKAPAYVVFKQRSIVVYAWMDDGNDGVVCHRWCYKRGA